MNIPIPMDHIAQAAQNGSPTLLHVVGRALGMGEAERDALSKGGIPKWVWVVLVLAGGVAAGVQVQKRWPAQAKWIGGGR